MLVDVSVERARQSLLDMVVCLPGEEVALGEARDRILDDDLHAPVDLPPVAQAAVDGYALGGEGPDVRGEYTLSGVLGRGRAVAVATGAPLPAQTVAVVAREQVRVEGERIRIAAALPAGRNIRPAGEDFRAGELVVPAGTTVDPGLIAVLAAFGRDRVRVRRRPRVGILSLGEEIVPAGSVPSPGQVRDANGPLLAALAARHGARAAAVETVGEAGAREAGPRLKRLLEQADLVLTIGGVASGPDDYALALLKASDARVLFWGVASKPGHHSGAAVCEDRPVIALSGNPAACAVAYQLLAAPVVRALQGLPPCPKAIPAVCTNSFPKGGGPRRFLRGCAACGPKGWEVTLLPGQKSSMLRSLINWNALVDLPAGHPPLMAGSPVSVLPL